MVEQKFIELFEEYTHSMSPRMPRRVFLERLTVLAGSSAAAYALLPLLENNYANAETIPANDPRIKATDETFPATDGVGVKAYVVKAANATGKLPTVIVIHENRGLNPHIKDIGRRMALEGFLVVTVDLMSMIGGTPATDEEAGAKFREVQVPKAVAELQDIGKLIAARADSNGKLGVVGFCWGGGTTNALVTDAKTGTLITAAVSYYGAPAGQPANAGNVKAAIMLHNGGLDTNTNAPYPAYIDALKAAGVKVQNFMYEGANHAFNNDTNAARFNEAAAKESWTRTVNFFKETLKA